MNLTICIKKIIIKSEEEIIAWKDLS